MVMSWLSRRLASGMSRPARREPPPPREQPHGRIEINVRLRRMKSFDGAGNWLATAEIRNRDGETIPYAQRGHTAAEAASRLLAWIPEGGPA